MDDLTGIKITRNLTKPEHITMILVNDDEGNI